MEMTAQVLKDLCKRNSLYRTPHLNDKLYANFQGFVRIANLEAYTGLKALFLEGNGLESLEGLPPLPELRYVQQNRLSRMTSLACLPKLHLLNVSNNELRTLAGLQDTAIETLICTHNYLQSADDVRSITDIRTLQTVDLQNNRMDDPEAVNMLTKLPALKCLYLKGNPVVSKIKNYRKHLISSIPTLTYLDDRPVFADERETVEAWARAGVAGEREARARIQARERERGRRNQEFMHAIRAEAFREKRERCGLPPGDTDPDLEGFSDDEWDFKEDPPELVQAQKVLDTYLQSSASDNTADGVPSAACGDGQDYLDMLKARQVEQGVSRGVSGLSADVLQPSMASATAQLASRKSGDMPALEPIPATPANASRLSELD